MQVWARQWAKQQPLIGGLLDNPLPSAGTVQVTRYPQEVPAECIIRDIATRMAQYATQFARHPLIVETARRVVVSCAPKDARCEVKRIYDFLKRHTRYVREMPEVMSTPAKLMRDIYTYGVASEDCESLTALLASMLLALGHRVRFAFGSVAYGRPYHHVWLQVYVNGKWWDIDLSERLPIGYRRPFPKVAVTSHLGV